MMFLEHIFSNKELCNPDLTLSQLMVIFLLLYVKAGFSTPDLPSYLKMRLTAILLHSYEQQDLIYGK